MKKTFALLAGLAVFATAPAFAQDDFSGHVKARQGQFRILAINLGILGGMAKGETPYNAEMAQHAADSLVAVSHIYEPPLWPEGSDNMSIDGTRALPSIWDERDDFLSKWDALGVAVAGMQEVAATGQAAIGPAMGKVGGACKACHDKHRAPNN
ncbi:c-type cytochrome [Puniceibacterium sediminis]|uniref:Cytochrome c556 n=1 Tax=Puniceibacterium sediminis TaxID=1608407 RepID=A0A238YI53_9RHOB|nr:cytochrome c [Puniceibacterium sediminis]SNR70936.1 Cytochrome c556 [Puniceibacterium sediminis]